MLLFQTEERYQLPLFAGIIALMNNTSTNEPDQE